MEAVSIIVSTIGETNSPSAVIFLYGIIALISFPPISPTGNNEFLM